ncbi:hypothetical protein [Archangium violaceum]
MAKLKIRRHERGQLVQLPLATSAEKETPGRLMAPGALYFQWRRRESNP